MLHKDENIKQSNLLNTMDHMLHDEQYFERDLDRSSAIQACVYIIDNHFTDNVEYTLGYLRINGDEYRRAGGGYLS